MNQLLTLSKALDILNILANSTNGLTVEQISTDLQIPNSTTYRLLQTLENYEFITRASHGIIQLGNGILALSRKIDNDYSKLLREISLPFMKELSSHINETIVLHIRTGAYTTCIENVPSTNMIRFAAENNRFLPIQDGCSGIAIITYEKQKIIDNIMDTLSEDQQLSLTKKMAYTKEHGYYISVNEFDSDAYGIGVPVYGTDKNVYGSLSIVGPETRMLSYDFDYLLSQLTSTSKAITAQLG